MAINSFLEQSKLSLTKEEQEVLDCMIESTIDNDGFILDELKCFGKYTLNQLKGYSSSLQKKHLIEMYNSSSYYDGRAVYLI